MHLRHPDPGNATPLGAAPHGSTPGGLAASQVLALQVMRRALALAPPPAATEPKEARNWREVGIQWRLAHARMVREQRVGLVVGAEGAVLLTRHEKRLLRATAAAQVPDPALVDNLIFALAPGRQLRPVLAEAVERLAVALKRHGHRLPAPPVAA